jgi:uncharacterized protein (UPF0212 family)
MAIETEVIICPECGKNAECSHVVMPMKEASAKVAMVITVKLIPVNTAVAFVISTRL